MATLQGTAAPAASRRREGNDGREHADRAVCSPDALHGWVREFVGVRIPRAPRVRGHDAPFDYLCHVYFDGLTPHDAPATPAAHPIDCVVWANRGGGKTYLGAVATALDLLHKRGIEIRILAGSLEQAGKMYAHLRRIFERPALAPFVKGRVTSRRITLHNSSTVELLAQSEFSVRGTRVQRLRCDEVELFDPAIWDAAQLTTRSQTTEGGRVIPGTIECLSTMHMPFGLMATLVREAQEGRRRLFKWSLLDVLERCGTDRHCRAPEPESPDAESERSLQTEGSDPASSDCMTQRTTLVRPTLPLPQLSHQPSLSPAGICPLLPECNGLAKHNEFAGQPRVAGFVTIADAIRMKSRVSAATWESEMLCRRANRSQTVYPEFDQAIHVGQGSAARGVPPASLPSTNPTLRPPLLCGMDFGYRAPTVILWATLDADTLTVIAEHVHAELILQSHVQAILDAPWGRPAWIGIDPAGNARNEQTGVSAAGVLRRAGLAVRSRPMSIHRGIDLVRARLRPARGPARLRIHPRCTHLIESLEKYHYDPKNPESLDPVKDGPDHAADALRYLITNLDAAGSAQTGNYLA